MHLIQLNYSSYALSFSSSNFIIDHIHDATFAQSYIVIRRKSYYKIWSSTIKAKHLRCSVLFYHFLWIDCGGLCASGNNGRFGDQAHLQGVRHLGASVNVHLRCWIWMVMGSSKLANSKWNLSHENSTNGPEHQRCCQLWYYICVVPNIFDNALPLQVWDIPVLFRLDRRNDHLCCAFPTGDERNSFGLDVRCVGAALVLGSVCSRYCTGTFSVNKFSRDLVGGDKQDILVFTLPKI